MTIRRQAILIAAWTIAAPPSLAAPPGARRALLIGINDYSASTLPARPTSVASPRDWSNLDGAVNDVRLMRELLVARHELAAEDILVLTDQQATRAAILQAIEKHLLRPAKKDDVLLFYYSGHGSQVRNTRSSEADQLDESLVPADSRIGAADIRDKELSAAFNRILDSGARLTVVIDACHSGSGARGMPGGFRHRAMRPDLRDVDDASKGARPEDRGAIVIAAAEDFDLAFETRDSEGLIRGAFSWAFARALRDADRDEAVSDTFLRAQARLRSEMPAQNPVLAGRAGVRLAPFLGTSSDRRESRPGIAIESVAPDGTYTLLGGWVHGLTVGTRVRVAGATGQELEVTALLGAGRAKARPVRDGVRAASTELHPGALLEISTWAARASRKLRVWIPRAPEAAIAEAKRMAKNAAAGRMQTIDDPTEVTPHHLLRWRNDTWERIASTNNTRGRTLFVQVPASSSLADAIGQIEGTDLVDAPDTADYILTGRITPGGVEYAWVRPHVTTADSERSALPLRTAWTRAHDDETALVLRAALLRLIRIHGWHELESPAGGGSHYRLAVRDARGGALLETGPLVGKRKYQLVLHLRTPRPRSALHSRYVYAFVIDSHGRSILLFPRAARGSVENRLPLTQAPARPIENPPEEIPLGEASFVVAPPYGVDSYFLLSTETPLSNPSVLEWDGVRSSSAPARTGLEALLAQSASGTRGGETIRTPPSWSLEKVFFESVPAGRVSR
ncbi:MAG: caspase family protein [Thermoanaerobaculia bacterium]